MQKASQESSPTCNLGPTQESGKADLFHPPNDLYKRIAKFGPRSDEIRKQSKELMKDDPELLKASLRTWILAAMKQNPGPGRLPTSKLNNLIYTNRGIRMREFIDLTGEAISPVQSITSPEDGLASKLLSGSEVAQKVAEKGCRKESRLRERPKSLAIKKKI